MTSGAIVTILGTAQDGGIPQAGCSCNRCKDAHNDLKMRKFPVSIGIQGNDGSKHIIEVTKNLSEQLMFWTPEQNDIFIPETVSITHLHLGHIEGMGQFGKPVMGLKNLNVYLTQSNKDIIDNRSDTKLMIEEGNIITHSVEFGKSFEPKEGCGFSLEFIPIPHRSELGDTAGILIKGKKRKILFLPDQDSWNETLNYYSKKNIREFLKMLEIDEAFVDGTFWSMDELPGRDIKKIPHPTIEETIKRLGAKRNEDPNISFLHLNHSNPVNDIDSAQRKIIEKNGWEVSKRGDEFEI